jgi:hypothetical protein
MTSSCEHAGTIGKGWTFRKTNHDHEAISSRGGKKKERECCYVPVDHAQRFFEESCLVPWPDVNLPAGWLLNSRRVLVPPVPREGCEWHDETRNCFILPPNPWDDLAFIIDSYNWQSFRPWEFDLRRRAGYLDNIGFLKLERGVVLDNEDVEDEGDDEDDLFNNGVQLLFPSA